MHIKFLRQIFLAMLLPVCFAGHGQGNWVSIGEPYDITTLYPIDCYSNYSRFKTIYTSTELGQAGQITAIKFIKNPISDLTVKNIEVYLGEITASSFPDGSWDVSSLTRVFNGKLLLLDNEEAVIELNVPFVLSSGKNLVVAISKAYLDIGETVEWSFFEGGESWHVSGEESFGETLDMVGSRPCIEIEFDGFYADAGIDKVLHNREQGIFIGGTPSIVGDPNGKTCSWTPTDGLNDSSWTNPLALPSSTTPYILTVSDQFSNTSTDDVLVEVLTEDDYYSAEGESKEIYTSGMTFYDSGGEEDYSYFEHYTVTFFPATPGWMIRVYFEDIGLDEGDTLRVYNGTMPLQSNLLNTFTTGEYYGEEFISEDSTGAITIEFSSNHDATSWGWNATIEMLESELYDAVAFLLDYGDGINSGKTIVSLSLDPEYGTFSNWEKKVGQTDWQPIDNSALAMELFLNTTTSFRAVIEGPEYPYSNIVTYQTSNNYYVNDDNQEGDKWCLSIGDVNESGAIPELPAYDISQILANYTLHAYDTVFVDVGDYTSEEYIPFGDIVVSENEFIVIYGAGRDTTKLNSTHADQLMHIWGSSYLKFVNLAFSSPGMTQIALIESSSNIVFDSCYFSNTSGMNINSTESQLGLSHNLFERNQESEYNIYLQNCAADISSNIITGGDIANIRYEGLLGEDSVSINRNFFLNTKNAIECVGIEGKLDIASNSFYAENSIYFEDGGNVFTGIRILNNILSSIGGTACINIDDGSFEDPNIFSICDYNDYYTTGGSFLVNNPEGSYSDMGTLRSSGAWDAGNFDENSLNADPLYLDPANGNLTIDAESGAFATGSDLIYFPEDIFGRAIPFGGMPIGSVVPVKSKADAPYAKLHKKPDGSYYMVTNGYLKFHYYEEYEVTGGTELEYNIYDLDNQIVPLTWSPDERTQGDNYYGEAALPCSWADKSYLLEVINDKGEKWYLRFKYTVPFYWIITNCGDEFFLSRFISTRTNNFQSYPGP